MPLDGDSVLDTSVLFAMIVYGLLGMLLHALIAWLTVRLVVIRRREPATAAADGASTPAMR